MDFGSSAQLTYRDAKVNSRIGTPGYYAPEILEGLPFGIAVDIYSLGALLYALFTFKLPFYKGIKESDADYHKRACHMRLNLEASPETAKLSILAKNLLHGMLEK